MLSKNNKNAKTKRVAKNGNLKSQEKSKKVTKKPSKQRGVFNLFFSLAGFVIIVGGIVSMFAPTLAKAEGIHIVEPFSCEVALADYHHLKESTQENNPQFVQEQLQQSLQLTIEALAEHEECEGVQNGK
jgi:uncharacterized membrane protein